MVFILTLWCLFLIHIYITYANRLVHHSNLSETVWYPPDLSEPSNLSDHPELRESRSDHPELSASPIFEGGHLPDNGLSPGSVPSPYSMPPLHDGVIKWKHCPRYWPFVRGIHRSPLNSPHKGQWRGTLMFSLICVWIIDWVNNREAGDLRRYRAHYDVAVMFTPLHHTMRDHKGNGLILTIHEIQRREQPLVSTLSVNVEMSASTYSHSKSLGL